MDRVHATAGAKESGPSLVPRPSRFAGSLGLRRVVVFTRDDNLASQRVMYKLGMRYEVDFKHAGLLRVLYSWSM